MAYRIIIPSLLAHKSILAYLALLGMMVGLAIDPTILAAATVTIITSLTGATVIIIKALADAKNTLLVRADMGLEKADSLSTKADIIKVSVDGASHRAAAKIDALQNEVGMLKSLLADKDRVAAVLAANESSVKQVVATNTDHKE